LLQAQRDRLIREEQMLQEERLAQEMEKQKLESMRDEKMRQQIRETRYNRQIIYMSTQHIPYDTVCQADYLHVNSTYSL
jgi:hypothetical protein